MIRCDLIDDGAGNKFVRPTIDKLDVKHDMAWQGRKQKSMIRHDTVWYSMAWHDTT